MSLAEKIAFEVGELPEAEQVQVLDYVEFLSLRRRRVESGSELLEWSEASLATALEGMEEEPELYSMADVKEAFR